VKWILVKYTLHARVYCKRAKNVKLPLLPTDRRHAVVTKTGKIVFRIVKTEIFSLLEYFSYTVAKRAKNEKNAVFTIVNVMT
jgi:hypothetical protein